MPSRRICESTDQGGSYGRYGYGDQPRCGVPERHEYDDDQRGAHNYDDKYEYEYEGGCSRGGVVASASAATRVAATCLGLCELRVCRCSKIANQPLSQVVHVLRSSKLGRLAQFGAISHSNGPTRSKPQGPIRDFVCCMEILLAEGFIILCTIQPQVLL